MLNFLIVHFKQIAPISDNMRRTQVAAVEKFKQLSFTFTTATKHNKKSENTQVASLSEKNPT